MLEKLINHGRECGKALRRLGNLHAGGSVLEEAEETKEEDLKTVSLFQNLLDPTVEHSDGCMSWFMREYPDNGTTKELFQYASALSSACISMKSRLQEILNQPLPNERDEYRADFNMVAQAYYQHLARELESGEWVLTAPRIIADKGAR